MPEQSLSVPMSENQLPRHRGPSDFERHETPAPSSGPTPRLELERYRALIEPHALTQEEADELLLTLWSIMRTFVDLGWGVESVQRVLPFTGLDWTNEVDTRPNDP